MRVHVFLILSLIMYKFLVFLQSLTISECYTKLEGLYPIFLYILCIHHWLNRRSPETLFLESFNNIKWLIHNHFFGT